MSIYKNVSQTDQARPTGTEEMDVEKLQKDITELSKEFSDDIVKTSDIKYVEDKSKEEEITADEDWKKTTS